MTETFISYYHSPLGWLKITGNNEFVSAITFIDDEPEASSSINNIIDNCMLQLSEYFEGNRKTFDFPIKQDGTDFQQKVWQLLSTIPYGKFISYTDLSKQYGDLKAIRAVAAANGKNHLAIVIPCHRVIGSSQKLVGYAGGLWRKKWLLDHESKHALGVQQFDF